MTLSQNEPGNLSPELREVVDAAYALLTAQGNDEGAPEQAQERSLLAAQAALAAGYSLADMAGAEALGKRRAREELRGELLRKVTRTAKRVQDATDEHHREIRRAAQIGLSTREIAAAAEVAHGTVRAIINRSERDAPEPGGEDRDERGETDERHGNAERSQTPGAVRPLGDTEAPPASPD